MIYNLFSTHDTATANIAETNNWLNDVFQRGVDWQATYSFWDWSNDALGYFHMYTAIAALVVGAVVLARRKGDIAHRLLGLLYIFSMFATNITALIMYDFTGGPNFFHIAAAMSLATSIGALVAIVVYASTRARLALETHMELMSWSYLGVVLAAVAEVITRGLGPQIDGPEAFWTVFSISMAVSGVVGAALVFIFIRNAKRQWFRDAT